MKDDAHGNPSQSVRYDQSYDDAYGSEWKLPNAGYASVTRNRFGVGGMFELSVAHAAL